MTNSSEIKQIIDIFGQEDNFLLTAHQDPDGDSIGSLIGLALYLESLGKKIIIYNEGRLPQKYRFLDPDNRIHFTVRQPDFKPAVAVILECPEYSRIGFVKELITDEMVIVNIDHHPRNAHYGKINYIDESACAVAEILYRIIKTSGHKITPRIAEAFYTAIASDTGRFKFTNTNSDCFNTAAELTKAGANPKIIADKIFSSYSAGTMKLLGHLLQTLELHANGQICILKLRLDDLVKYGVPIEETEGIIDYSLAIAGVKVGILFKEKSERTVKVGLRSQNGINIAKYAMSKGGGGHANAAGFSIDSAFDEAIRQTVTGVAEYLNG